MGPAVGQEQAIQREVRSETVAVIVHKTMNVSEEVQAGSSEEKGPLPTGRRTCSGKWGVLIWGGERLDEGFEVRLRPISEEWSREEVEKGTRGEREGGQGYSVLGKVIPHFHVSSYIFSHL